MQLATARTDEILSTLTREMDKQRILVVDDDSFMRSLLARLLCSKGYLVFEAAHGDGAVEIAAREPLDLILLDLLLPGEDGHSVCRRIKSMAANKAVPVVFLTGMMNDEDIAEGLAAGGIDSMQKPFEPQAILQRVRGYLESADDPCTAESQAEEDLDDEPRTGTS